MHPRSRVLRITKWTGVCLGVLILTAWGISLRWHVIGGNSRWIRLEYGNIGVGWYFCLRAEF
jgi:hypothetical protein